VSRTSVILLWLLLAAACFASAAALQPRLLIWGSHGESENVLKILMGDGRRLFANHFLVKADVYFHSGYYPSIFDQAGPRKTSQPLLGQGEEHHEEAGGHGQSEESEHEKEMNFLRPPADWIESFGRNFQVTKHTHLEHGTEREILPWLKLSAELNPQNIQTYTVAAYWLRSHLGKVKEAEEFLRQGRQANPESYEILFELGRLFNENYHDSARARNVWELALRRWNEQEPRKKDPNKLAFDQITANLGRLEEEAGNLDRAIAYFEQAKTVSPSSAALDEEIRRLKQKLSGTPRP
jgi:tetratricopeptide (TPR) repeat protein